MLYSRIALTRRFEERRGLLVGVSPQPRFAQTASGVGHDPHTLALVRCTDVACAQHAPARIEPQRGQVSEYSVETSNSESWAVLHERTRWSYLANDASELRPET
jgi:hypothetical protein